MSDNDYNDNSPEWSGERLTVVLPRVNCLKCGHPIKVEVEPGENDGIEISATCPDCNIYYWNVGLK